jgi:hypothetical protein
MPPPRAAAVHASSAVSLAAVGSRGAAASAAAPPPATAVAVVRHLRRGDIPRAAAAFRRVPPADQRACPALHEALVLACAHVPDAHAAAAVLAAAPNPTLAAFSHCATAHLRERNPDAAVALLEGLAASGLPLDPRVIGTVERSVRKGSGGSDAAGGKGGRGGAPTPRRPRPAGSPQTPSLLARLSRLSRMQSSSPGLRAISLSAADFFEDDGGDVDAWISARNLAHAQSLRAAAEATAGGGVGGGAAPADVSPPSSTGRPAEAVWGERPCVRSRASRLRPPDVALRMAAGNIARVDALWSEALTDPGVFAEPAVLAAAVSAFLACGWRGAPRALDALSAWLDAHARDRNAPSLAALLSSPTRRAMLLTAATSALAASASTAPRQALAVCDAVAALPAPAFQASLPLSGAVFKVLRHSRLSLQATAARIDRVRERLVQLDERSFSTALSAILECAAPAPDKWAYAGVWVDKMRLAGVPLTHHTCNALAGQLRYLNNPEMTTSLLRDMARAGVMPTAYTYSLLFDSCVAPGRYAAGARRRALPSGSLLSMLEAIEKHMAVSGVAHSSASRFALARAFAHLGRAECAVRQFDAAAAEAAAGSAADAAAKVAGGRPWGPLQARREYNQMIFNSAHCRCTTPDGPAAAFDFYTRMRLSHVMPTAATLEYLLAACVRVGDNARALAYVSEFSDLQAQAESSLLLRSAGLESLYAVLAKAGNMAAWNVCEAVLSQGMAEARRRSQRPPVPYSAVVLAVLAFARRGERAVCEQLIAVSGVGDLADSRWELMLDGTSDFERVRAVRHGKRQSLRDEGAVDVMSPVHGDGAQETTDEAGEAATRPARPMAARGGLGLDPAFQP